MSEETKNTNTGEQSTNSTPEANGGHGGEKMFTQEDVNRIIAERLAKERAKGQPPAADQQAINGMFSNSRLILEQDYYRKLGLSHSE